MFRILADLALEDFDEDDNEDEDDDDEEDDSDNHDHNDNGHAQEYDDGDNVNDRYDDANVSVYLYNIHVRNSTKPRFGRLGWLR